MKSSERPARQNLQQRWPESERAWLKAAAKAMGVSETDLLLALVRREGHGEEGAGRPVDDYLPAPSPRSKRARRLRAERNDSAPRPVVDASGAPLMPRPSQ